MAETRLLARLLSELPLRVQVTVETAVLYDDVRSVYQLSVTSPALKPGYNGQQSIFIERGRVGFRPEDEHV